MNSPVYRASLRDGFLYYTWNNLPCESRLIVHSFDYLKIHRNKGKNAKTVANLSGKTQIFGKFNLAEKIKEKEYFEKTNNKVNLLVRELSDDTYFYVETIPRRINSRLIFEHHKEDALISRRTEPHILARGIERFLYLSGVPEPDIIDVKTGILMCLEIDKEYATDSLSSLDDGEKFNLLFQEALKNTPPKKEQQLTGPQRLSPFPYFNFKDYDECD